MASKQKFITGLRPPRGDVNNLENICAQYRPQILRAIFYKIRGSKTYPADRNKTQFDISLKEMDAEDITQEVLHDLCRQWDRLPRKDTINDWLSVVATNKVGQYLEYANGNMAYEHMVSLHVDDEDSASMWKENLLSRTIPLIQKMLHKNAKKAIAQAISELPSPRKEMFTDRYIYDLPVEMLVERYAMTRNYFDVTMDRIKRTLKVRLEELGITSDDLSGHIYE